MGIGSAILLKAAALKLVREERERQDAKWGEQNHPPLSTPANQEGYYPYARWEYALVADQQKEYVDRLSEAGFVGWDAILLEEVYEAFGSKTPEEYEEELIQVAAVAVSAWESSRRNRGLIDG